MITIEEGRKAYNLVRNGAALEIYRMKHHEAAVEAFFAQVQAERPEDFARVAAQYPVLTERQLEDRRERELFAFGPGDYEDGTDDNVDGNNPEGIQDMVRLASLVAHRQEQERIALAELRGEPV